jgi:hypothetical protein
MIGETFEAELVFYASPVPLRALIANQTSGSSACQAMPALPEAGLAAQPGRRTNKRLARVHGSATGRFCSQARACGEAAKRFS